MDRRGFMTRALGLLAAGVAADQLDLLERLAPPRRLFTTGGYEPRMATYEFSQTNKRYPLTVDEAVRAHPDWIRHQIFYQSRKSVELILQRAYGL